MKGDVLQEITGTVQDLNLRAYALSGQNIADGATRVRVIAVEGAVSDWAAYAHFVNTPTTFIHEYGTKLHRADATRLFPVLNPGRYRP